MTSSTPSWRPPFAPALARADTPVSFLAAHQTDHDFPAASSRDVRTPSPSPDCAWRVVASESNGTPLSFRRMMGSTYLIAKYAPLAPTGSSSFQELRVGVVGCGGTGSAVLEQLTRLGVGSLTFADDDVVTPTNVTRIYGSTLDDVDRPKVDVLRDHLARIGLGTELSPSPATSRAGRSWSNFRTAIWSSAAPMTMAAVASFPALPIGT